MKSNSRPAKHAEPDNHRMPERDGSKDLLHTPLDHASGVPLPADNVIDEVLNGVRLPSSQELLQMQRTMGNQAVGQFLQHVDPLPVVQPKRKDDDQEESAEPPPAVEPNRTGLPDVLKTNIEHLSSTSLNDVNVHYNSPEPAQLKAHAFTKGNDIFVAPGQQRHLAHEAWHVVQQKQSLVQPTRFAGDVAVNDSPGLEREADLMAQKATQLHMTETSLMPEQSRAMTFQTTHAVAHGEGVVQRMGYEELDHVQRVQIDAIAESVYRQKAVAFEQRLAQAANGNDAVRTGVKALHEAFVGGAVADRIDSAAQVRALLASIDNADEIQYAHVNQTLTEDRAQTTATLDLNRSERPVTHAREQTGPQPGGAETLANFPGGNLRLDSQYAQRVEQQLQRALGGASKEAALLMQIANAQAKSDQEKRQILLALMAALVPANQKSFFEILEGAQNGLQSNLGGARLYREFDSIISNSDIGRLYPDHFLSPAFLNELSHYVFNDTVPERQRAAQRIPADVLLTVQNIVGVLAPRHELLRRHDAALDQYLPRSLYDNLTNAQFDFVKDDLIGQRTAILQRMRGNFRREYDQIFDVGTRTHHIDPGQLTFILHLIFGADTNSERIAGSALFPSSQAGNRVTRPVGHEGDRRASLLRRSRAVANFLGNFDRGVDITTLRGQTENLIGAYPEGAYGIQVYTSRHYTRVYNVLRYPEAPQSTTGLLSDRERKIASQRALAATIALEDANIPVYGQRVFRGVPGQVAGNAPAIQTEVDNFQPGTVISDGVLWSASKSLKDIPRNIYRPNRNQILFVIDDISTGKDVQLLADQHWHQREVLFPPYARFVVTHVDNTLNPQRTGNMIVYLKEISPQADNYRNPASQQAFNEYKEKRITARTFIDRAHFEQAEAAYLTEQPVPGPLQQLENDPRGILEPNLLYGPEGLQAWEDTQQRLPGLYTVSSALARTIQLSNEESAELQGAGFNVQNQIRVSFPDNTYPLNPQQRTIFRDWGFRVNAVFRQGVGQGGRRRYNLVGYKIRGAVDFPAAVGQQLNAVLQPLGANLTAIHSVQGNQVTVLKGPLRQKLTDAGFTINAEAPVQAIRAHGLSVEFLRQAHINLIEHDATSDPGEIRDEQPFWTVVPQGYQLNLDQAQALLEKGLILSEQQTGNYTINANGNFVENGATVALDVGRNAITVVALCRLLGFTVTPNSILVPNPYHIVGNYTGPLYYQNALAFKDAVFANVTTNQDPRFDVTYPHANRGQVTAALQQFVVWYNGELVRIDALPTATVPEQQAKRDAVIRFASEAQQRLVALHPFGDANGRTSRYVFYLTFKLFYNAPRNLIEPIIPDTDADLITSYADWANQIRDQILNRQGGHD